MNSDPLVSQRDEVVLDALSETFFDRMPMGVALIDANMVLQRFNPTWADYVARYAGIPEEQVSSGRSLFTMMPGTEHEFAPRFERVLAGETIREEALHLRSADLDMYLDVALTPQRDSRRVTHILLVATDVTERVQAQRQAERRVADRTRRLSALYEVMELASEPLDLTTMLTRLLERVLAAVRSQAGAIYLLDESGENLQQVAQLGLPEAQVDAGPVALEESGLPGAVLRQERPLVIANLHEDPRSPHSLRHTELRAYAGVAMYARGRPIGVLSVFRESRRPFIGDDLALLDSVTDQIGVAVENSRLRQKAEQLAIVEERARLARELHDAITQSLYSISLMATASRRLQRADGESVRLLDETLADLAATAQHALKEMRLLLYRLRPLALQQHNLVEALRQRLAAVEERAGVDATLSVGDFIELPPAIEEGLFHIAQEALNNALKHANASRVRVTLHQQGSYILLQISDNGRGLDASGVEGTGGMGLTTMRERAENLGGTLEIEGMPEKGTVIAARIPL